MDCLENSRPTWYEGEMSDGKYWCEPEAVRAGEDEKLLSSDGHLEVPEHLGSSIGYG